jgi:hypothetical protein
MTSRPAPAGPSGRGPAGEEYVAVARATLDAATELIAGGHDHDERVRAAAYEQGRQAHLAGGYQAGYALGHDTGLSARQDARGYVHGILDGFHDGCEQRHQLTGQLLHRGPARPAASPDREAEAS